MDNFGDYEPEDAWDNEDSSDVLVDILRRMVALLILSTDRDSDRDKMRAEDTKVGITYVLDRHPANDLLTELILLTRVLELIRKP